MVAKYKAVLDRSLDPELALIVAERCVYFLDEWGEDKDTQFDMLRRVLEIDSTVQWAFDRASLQLTTNGRWDELLDLYDRVIGDTKDETRRAALLEEVAHVAKDSAGNPERAIEYLKQVFALKPADKLIASALERLLKQKERYRELIDIWNARLKVLEGDEVLETYHQIAACWLENLNDPGGALAAVESLLADESTSATACQLLEQILASPASNREARARALEHLSDRYDDTDRWEDVVRPLELAIGFVELEERAFMHTEIARRLVGHDRLDDALEHLAALAVIDAKSWGPELLTRVLSGKFKQEVAGCKPQLDKEGGRKLIRVAAQLAAGSLDDSERAIELYERLLDDSPEDLDATRRLADLYQRAARLEDLLKLRRHEFGLADSLEKRLALRLEIARLLRLTDDIAESLKVLRDNLADQADHEPSIRALIQLLEDAENPAELVEFLRQQAEAVEALERDDLAADLWRNAAQLSEVHLADLDLALQCYERVVALSKEPDALDALANIHASRGEHATAAGWLEQRLTLAEPGARTATIVRLAAAYIGAEQHEPAVHCLEDGLQEDPASIEMRHLLADVHRQLKDWEALAAVLQDGAELVSEEAKRFELLREAAEIYTKELGAPERAVDVLEKTTQINPADRAVRTQLADALRAAGRMDEARALAEELIGEFRRRRPPERAALHLLLAQIADSVDDTDEALKQLELAASMDVSNAQVQYMLGSAYRKAGELEKAERAYQALLLVLRRQRSQPTNGDLEGRIGVSEALFAIHQVAAELGDDARAEENLESAFDAASQAEDEALLFERTLRGADAGEMLMRALDQRLKLTTDPATRAEILADKARVLDQQLGRPDDAFDALLSAIEDLPSSGHLHYRAHALAVRTDGLMHLKEVLTKLSKQALEDDDRPLAADLLLRLGGLLENELIDADAAAEHYARAESTNERLPDVWRAMARMAATRGQRAEEFGALRKLTELPAENLGEERIEILYRLAELELSFPDSLYAGLDTLGRAIEAAPQYERAAQAIRQAFELAPGDATIVNAFEQVARSADDKGLLLDALERRCKLPGTTQDTLEEAVDVANELDRAETADALLLRAIEVARDEVGDLSQALWALRIMIVRCRDDGNLEDAIRWMQEASEVVEEKEARALKLEIAKLAAGPLNDVEMAADTYESLLEDDPGDPSIWKPALDVLRKMGDRHRVERVLTKAAEAVSDPHAQNQLRVAKARLLLGVAGRQDDAVDTLREVLAEDPDHQAAAEMLCDLLGKLGQRDELADLLQQQVDRASQRGDKEAGVQFTLRLGAQIAETRREAALSAYRDLLEWVPDEARVLEALVRLLSPEDDAKERADALERLLELNLAAAAGNQEVAPHAVELALELSRARESLDDLVGRERALELAHQLSPAHAQVPVELERLADALEAQAVELSDPDASVEMLQKAAAIYWNRLDNTDAAAKILHAAQERQPDNTALIGKLVRCLIESGRAADAIETVTAALERHQEEGSHRIRLLRLRVTIRATSGDYTSAVEDLEEALRLGAEGLEEELKEALEQAKEAAARARDHETERSMTLRLAEVLRRLGSEEEAQEEIAAWVGSNPADKEAINILLQADLSKQRWDDAAESYTRLLKLEEGDARIDAALGLADAYAKAGKPESARRPLEDLYKQEPSTPRLRLRLRALYEEVEAYRELANLLLVEANDAEDDDERFELLREAGRIRVQQGGQAATAIGPLMEALDIRPKDPLTTLMLADAYTAAGFNDDAVALLQGAIDRHGNRRSKELAALQHRMARAVADHNPDAALTWLVAAWESHPQSGELASELADQAMDLEKHDIALKALRALAAMRTPAPISRPMALLKQAEISKLQGDERKAGFLAKKALAEDPDLPEAQAFMADLAQE